MRIDFFGSLVIVLSFIALASILFFRAECFATTREVMLDDVPVYYIEGNSVAIPENIISGSASGREKNNIELCGLLNDTGVINTFCFYKIDGNSILSTYCTLEERIYKNINKPAWVNLNAASLSFSKNGNLIKAVGFKPIEDVAGIISRAGKLCESWANGARRNVGLNLYKKTDRFKKAFSKFSDRDLSVLEFRHSGAAHHEYIDFVNSKIAVEAGRYVISETDNRKDYLVCVAIFDMKTLVPLRIIIVNSGEFLE